MEKPVLRPDCTRCAALCCIALAFDRSDRFAIDKPAQQPCPNLDTCGTCTIHAARVEEGYQGCLDFDCFGAGQRVTQAFFGGRNWIDDPSLIAPMSQAFVIALQAHDCLILLDQAEKLDLTPTDRHRARQLGAAVAAAGVSAELLQPLRQETLAFLQTLRVYVDRDHQKRGHRSHPQPTDSGPG